VATPAILPLDLTFRMAKTTATSVGQAANACKGLAYIRAPLCPQKPWMTLWTTRRPSLIHPEGHAGLPTF